MSLEDIDPQFRLDSEVAPQFKCENYNPEERTFEVWYNDGHSTMMSGMVLLIWI